MKDLKHLICFENLLQEANNDLVQQAIREGNKAIAYTCYHIPEVLLNVGNCFSVRLRAPRTGSMDIATYYLSSYLCGYSKALLERDTAYELGGGQTPCVSTLAVSSGRAFDNSVTLVGPELTEIRRDCSFGKVVLLQIDDVQEQAAFFGCAGAGQYAIMWV